MALSENELLLLKSGRLATGGSNITLVDAGVNWLVNSLVGVPLKIIHATLPGSMEYNTVITSNTATQLTFPALPVAVAAGDAYFFLPDLAAFLLALATQGLVYKGTVTAAVAGVSFTIASLAGLGAGAFGDPTAPYRAFVMRSAGGVEGAPQGEMAAITAYTTATGLFTPNGPPAFTVNIAVGDEVLILHPRLAEIFDILTRFNTAGAAMSVVSQPGVAARTNLNAILTDLANILAGAAGITNFPAAAVPADGVSLAEVIRQIYNDVIALTGAGILHEQADVPFNVNATLAEANIFDLSAANTRYVVRSLRLNCVDPGAQTVTVRLYELINDVLTLVDTFAITTANFATAHSLMDMFGLEHLAGDNLKVTVIATAAGPYAVTGQYCTATAGV